MGQQLFQTIVCGVDSRAYVKQRDESPKYEFARCDVNWHVHRSYVKHAK